MNTRLGAQRRNWLVRFLSSVWLGVVLLLLILMYASVVSALPQVRGAIEMSEMQVFRHWLFASLCGLFCLSMLLATLLRSRWNAAGAGGIITHVGLLLLVGGSAWYFGSKIEGDVLLFSPRIEIQTVRNGVPRTVDSFLAAPHERWNGLTGTGSKEAHIRVLETRGLGLYPVTEVKLEVLVGDDPPKEVTLAMAKPRRVELQDGLAVQLHTFAPTRRFYDDELPALYYRNMTDGQAQQRYTALPELPWSRERYLDAGYLVRDVRGNDVPSKRVSPYLPLGGLHIPTGWFERWRLPIRPSTPDLPFDVEVTGYLPYTSETGYDAYTQDGRRLSESEQSSVDMTHVQIVPHVQPLELRRPGLGRGPSAIRLKFIGKGDLAGWSEMQWCPFSQYPDLDAVPVRVRPPKSSVTWEFIYSRFPRDLGARLAGDRLSVSFFPGRQSAQSWRSDFLAQPDRAPAPLSAAVYTNQTYTVGPYSLFQSGAAADHWSWTILGVGNRRGIWPMTVGCVLIVLGALYAFYVKPLILRRRFGPLPRREGVGGGFVATTVLLAAVLFTASPATVAAEQPFAASVSAINLDHKLDWSAARLIVVQDAGRYKTLESFARESMAAMYGSEHLPGLSPLASLLDWLFNNEAYLDSATVRIRDPGLRVDLSTHLPEKDRRRIQSDGYMTPRELTDPTVLQRLRELEPRFDKGRAIGRIRNAQTIALSLPQLLHIVPQPGDDPDAAWHTPDELQPNAARMTPEAQALSADERRARFGDAIAGIAPEQAVVVVGTWAGLRKAWLAGDATGVQKRLNRLAEFLPTLAPPGGYPAHAQRVAEARYYAWGKFTWAYWVYFLGTLVGVWALLTRWRMPWLIALALLLIALALHAYGLGLRWYILGHIPVANMFEAITASAWLGIVLALIAELICRLRIFLLAAHVTGFFSLLLANQVLPGELTSMMGILDDLMLRLHTTLIIAAYALIFLAAVIAVVYLIGYYAARVRGSVLSPAAMPALLGTSLASPRVAASPGESDRAGGTPQWLQRMDWSHLIMLDMMFVLLFVGIILGAVWADYSWGRPWGWDPKEVFAMNTWLVYAILFHVRLLVRDKGLWTAWLSLAGCAMMAFNWWIVNFYIVGLHSYA